VRSNGMAGRKSQLAERVMKAVNAGGVEGRGRDEAASSAYITGKGKIREKQVTACRQG